MRLIDDGTMDTVFQCPDCKGIERFDSMSEHRGPNGELDSDAYDRAHDAHHDESGCRARSVNWLRADDAAIALQSFEGSQGSSGEDDRTLSIDLLTNLFHLAHRDGWDLAGAIETARGHFETENNHESN